MPINLTRHADRPRHARPAPHRTRRPGTAVIAPAALGAALLLGTGTDAAAATPAADTGPPAVAPCPAYLGPQCDSVAHELWMQGQALLPPALGPQA